jgi:nucleotide-binding universal stress UspA family protein
MKVNTILVPLDGSPLAEAALPTAVELVKGDSGTTVVLLRAVDTRTLPGLDLIKAHVSVIREAEEYLEAVATRLRAKGVPVVRTSVWYGAAAPAIIEAAQVANADLIVMSTPGRSGLGRLVLGSVAASVLRGARTPVLLVRDGNAAANIPPEYTIAPEKEDVNV